MKIINIRNIKEKQFIHNFGYLENGNLACLLENIGNGYLNRDYHIFDIIEKKIINELNYQYILPYKRLNSYCVKNKNIFNKIFDYGKYIINLTYYVLRLETDTVPGMRNLVVDTDYGFAGIVEFRSSIDENNISQIVFLKDNMAIESNFKLPHGKFHKFIPSHTEVNKFIFYHSPKSSFDIYLRNHNNNSILCGRTPVAVDYSPDNKNIALAPREKAKRTSNKFSILDAETLQVRYTMEVPFVFSNLMFSQDGNKIALISNYQILELDID